MFRVRLKEEKDFEVFRIQILLCGKDALSSYLRNNKKIYWKRKNTFIFFYNGVIKFLEI